MISGKVLIHDLELHAYHGWHRHEGEFGQPYLIHLELETDLTRAAGSATVELARGLLTRFPPVDAVFVRVMKLKPPIPERIAAAGVELRLTRADMARAD